MNTGYGSYAKKRRRLKSENDEETEKKTTKYKRKIILNKFVLLSGNHCVLFDVRFERSSSLKAERYDEMAKKI